MFGRHQQRITGRVIAAKDWRQYGDVPYLMTHRYKYVVEYTLPTGETKRVELKQAMGLNSMKMRNVQVGEEVPLLLHRRSGSVDFDVDDPRIALDSRTPSPEDRRADRDAYKSALEDGAGVSPDPGGSPNPKDGRPTVGDPEELRARWEKQRALRQANREGDTAEAQRLAAELEMPRAGTVARSPSGDSPGSESIEQRLATLQRLHDEGALTSEEYSAQRQRILDSL